MKSLNNLSETSFYRDQYFEMWIEDGVFFITVTVDSFTLEMAHKCVVERLALTNGKAYPMLSDSRKVMRFDKEARAFLARSENTQCISAGAILIENYLQKVIGNFFLLINKPIVSAKLFTDRVEALEWLQQFKGVS